MNLFIAGNFRKKLLRIPLVHYVLFNQRFKKINIKNSNLFTFLEVYREKDVFS